MNSQLLILFAPLIALLLWSLVIGGAMWLMMRSRKNLALGIIGAIIVMVFQAMFATGFAVYQAHGTDYRGAYIAWQIIVVILWALVFAVCRAKNRYAPTWLVLTFFFGPIPLVVLAFMPRLEYRDEELQKCPHCLSTIPVQATVCRFCQRNVVALEAT